MGVPGSGRRPKTREELTRQGTYRKDRHGDRKSPEPTAGRPEAPAGFDSVEQSEWDRMLWAFEDMGMLHKVDVVALEQYCRLYAETQRVSVREEHLEASIDRLEENIGDFKGEDFLKLAQEITQQQKLVSKCTDQLRAGRMAIRQYLVEFGLTPASRGRIKLPSTTAEVDEFTQFQQAKPPALARVK